MANNRLYILDTETNEAFMLCKSSGEGWYTFQRARKEEGVMDWIVESPEVWMKRLDEWLGNRDVSASFGNSESMNTTRLRLVTEHELPADAKT